MCNVRCTHTGMRAQLHSGMSRSCPPPPDISGVLVPFADHCPAHATAATAGNSAGDVYVYDAASGGRAAHHPAHKVGGPARAAALSEDGRHLLVVRGNGYILRCGECGGGGDMLRASASAACCVHGA